MIKFYETELAGRKLSIETGKFANQANGSVTVRYGDTMVMTNVTAAKEADDSVDFFPLSVEFEEKMYSVGKIPGSFNRREGKPSESSVLVSRAIDRPVRPLFPHDFKNGVTIVNTVLSDDQDNSPEVCAQIGTSAALSISDIPWGGPTASVQVGLVDGKIIINPNAEEAKLSDMKLTVAGTEEQITMIECGAKEVSNDVMYDAIVTAHTEIKKICKFISEIKAEIGKEKFEYKSYSVDSEYYKAVQDRLHDEMYEAVKETDKVKREENVEAVTEKIKELAIEMWGENAEEEHAFDIATAVHDIEKECVRKIILTEKIRPDGRKIDEIRPLYAEAGLIPRVHGSGLFSRGQTQVLSIATLGTKSDSQLLDDIDLSRTEKRYMHHYNFPGYSVGDARPSRGPGRREIGHGALAEKALVPVLPSVDEFPYTIRVVSEVLESNGSTSQASICGSTLALMDAGVPIKKPVAGISCGLITDEENPENSVVLTDIQDIEDFFGDMDFKVGGTKDGITAIQVDIKLGGLPYEVIKQALERTKIARDNIIDNYILKAIPAPREDVSEYAPKIVTMHIDKEKIKEVIGSGGKVINKIIEQTGVQIDIDDDGRVDIYSTDKTNCEKAARIVYGITREIVAGEVYEGIVTRIMNFGAFVDIGGGREGLLHISKISKEHIEKVEDVLAVGDEVVVKVSDIDSQGRINLNMKDLEKSEDKKEE